MEHRAPESAPWSRTGGIALAGAGFVGLASGLVLVTVRESWTDAVALTLLVLGAALTGTAALLNLRVASLFAVAAGLLCLLVPLLHRQMVYASVGGVLVTLIGLGLVVQGLVLNRKELEALFRTRRGLAGVNVAASIALALVFVVVVNLISVRHNRRMDLTGSRAFSLSSKTQQVLDNLAADVQVFSLLHPGDPVSVQLRELLNEYEYRSRRKGGRMTVEWLYPTSQEALAQIEKLRAALKEAPKRETVIVRYGTGESAREKHLRRSDLIEYASRSPMMPGGPPKIKAEEEITAAIIAVTEGKEQKVYFTAGHGELDPDNYDEREGISRVIDGLKRDNYAAEKINLATRQAIPPDCGALVVTGPKTKFSTLEVDLISDYLDNRGKLLVMLDPLMKEREKSGLEPLLEKWGVTVRSDAVVAGPEFLLGQIIGFNVQFGAMTYPAASTGNPIVSPITNQSTVFTFVAPLETSDSPGARAKIDVLVESEKEAWGETKTDTDEWKPDADDLKGPMSLVVAASEKDPNEPPPNPYGPPPPPSNFKGARLVVFGDSDLIVNKTATPTNEALFVNTINWLTEQEQKLGIPPKMLEVGRVDYNDTQGTIIFYVSIIGLPGLALVAGCVVYLIRRT